MLVTYVGVALVFVVGLVLHGALIVATVLQLIVRVVLLDFVVAL